MPSLTQFVFEISTEEPYGREVVARLDERLNSLNDSQIAGLSEHLELAAAKARSRLWREGNEAVWAVARDINKQRIEAYEERTRETKARDDEERLRVLYEKINEENRRNMRNDIEKKARKQAFLEVQEYHDRKVIKQKIDNVQNKWRRDRVKYRLYFLGVFLAFMGFLFLLALDPSVHGSKGVVLLVVFLFLGAISGIYGYWRGLAFVKRSKPEEIEAEIESRKDDLVHKVYIKVQREEDRARRIEEAEERMWAMRRAEKKRLKKEAKIREREVAARARGEPKKPKHMDNAHVASGAEIIDAPSTPGPALKELQAAASPGATSTNEPHEQSLPASNFEETGPGEEYAQSDRPADEDLEEITLMSGHEDEGHREQGGQNLLDDGSEEDLKAHEQGGTWRTRADEATHDKPAKPPGSNLDRFGQVSQEPEIGDMDGSDEDSFTASVSTFRTALTAGTRGTRVTVVADPELDFDPPTPGATPVMPFTLPTPMRHPQGSNALCERMNQDAVQPGGPRQPAAQLGNSDHVVLEVISPASQVGIGQSGPSLETVEVDTGETEERDPGDREALVTYTDIEEVQPQPRSTPPRPDS